MSDRSSLVGTADDCASERNQSPGTGVPLVMVSAYQDEQLRHKAHVLPDLPSHRFRYSVWHNLSQTSVTGDRLKAPRIRDGPPEKEEMFYKIKDENNRRIHHSRRGEVRKNYQDTTQNWQNATVCNLSYQDLGHNYQMDSFRCVLRKLLRAEQLTLLDNRLQSLSSITFPVCTQLNLSRNCISSFKDLPKIPRIQWLMMSHNNIQDLHGLEVLKKTQITYLNLKGNPVAFTLNYRQCVFGALPELKVLDDLPRILDDDEPAPDHLDQTAPADINKRGSDICRLS